MMHSLLLLNGQILPLILFTDCLHGLFDSALDDLVFHAFLDKLDESLVKFI